MDDERRKHVGCIDYAAGIRLVDWPRCPPFGFEPAAYTTVDRTSSEPGYADTVGGGGASIDAGFEGWAGDGGHIVIQVIDAAANFELVGAWEICVLHAGRART